MIGRLLSAAASPDDEPAESFVPLRYDYGRSGNWVPIEKPGVPFATEIAAARACIAHLQRLWQSVESGARIVCGLVGNPDVELETVRDAASTLAERMARFDADIALLLDAPGTDDTVHIGSVCYRQNPASRRLEPCVREEPDDDSDDVDHAITGKDRDRRSR